MLAVSDSILERWEILVSLRERISIVAPSHPRGFVLCVSFEFKAPFVALRNLWSYE